MDKAVPLPLPDWTHRAHGLLRLGQADARYGSRFAGLTHARENRPRL